MRAWGSRYARLVFERCGRNKRHACRMLDISYHTLQAYLRYTPHLRGAQKALPAPDARARPRQGHEDRTVAAGDQPPAAASVPLVEATLVPE